MDFHQLLAKMQQLDQPVKEASVEECGEPMGQMPAAPNTPVTTPPSLSVNLNAQGLDNIEDILKLITKVNPDAVKPMEPGLPMLSPEPSIASIKPPAPISDLGNLDAGPLKMLPDLDSDAGPEMPGGDEVTKPEGDLDNDGDHDMDDHEMEKDDEKETDETRYTPGEYGGEHDPDPEPAKKSNPFPFADDEEESEEEEKEEAFGNSLNKSEPEYKDSSFSTHDGNDLNRSKKTFPKVAGGDNPMQKMESGDLRAQIRAELLQRLEEAKGAK